MVYNASDTADWGHLNRRMTYITNKANNNFCKSLVAMNMASSPTKEISDEITALDAAEFIDACFDNCEFALDVRMFEHHLDLDQEQIVGIYWELTLVELEQRVMATMAHYN